MFLCADDGQTSKAHIGCIVSAPTRVRNRAEGPTNETHPMHMPSVMK